MRRLAVEVLLLLFFGVALHACNAVPTPQTFNEREAAAISAVTEVRRATLTLLQAEKITAADAQNVQKQADAIVEGLKVARTLHSTNAAAATDKLQATLAILTALQGYIASKGT